MSTILDALKRLEDKPGAEDAKQEYLPARGREVASGSRSRRWLVIALIGLSVLVGGAVILWVFNDRDERPLPRQTAQAEPPSVAAAPEKPSDEPSAKPTARRRRAADVRTDENRSVRSISKTILTSPDYVPPDPESRTYGTASTKSPPNVQAVAPLKSFRNSSSPAASNTSQPAAEETSSSPSGAQPSAPDDPYALVETLPRDALQLQAISWSDIPNSRVTIIAGRILREGQNVEGYTVLEIRPEDVILEKEGIKWKVVYGGR